MKDTLKHKQTLIFTLLSIAILVFIFSNSATPSGRSNATSTGLMDWLRPLLEPLFASRDAMHKFIRKAAHFTEFGALGFCVGMSLEGCRRRYWRGGLVFCPLFLLLSVGVTDEFIQSFFDRTSAVKDVLLDFFGGAFGVVCSVLVCRLMSFIQKKDGAS